MWRTLQHSLILCVNLGMGFLLEASRYNIPYLLNIANTLSDGNVISHKHLMFNIGGLREEAGTVFPKVDCTAGECVPRTESVAKTSLLK